MLRILLVVTLLCVQVFTAENTFKRTAIHLDTEDRIAKDGYYSESHRVTTSDGYILEINRIPFGRGENKNAKKSKPVVFLMHGLQGSAFAYFSSGPDGSMAYNLADSGYDVWMGNARGVLNSRNHVTLDPDSPKDKKKFFDFTFEDIATKDIPKMIDFVLAFTGKSQLHYIGHSQGGTSFLVLTSMLPEYNEKIASAHLLAGVGYQRHFPNTILSLAAISTAPIYTFAMRMGLIEILGPEWNDIDIGECSSNNEACGLFNVAGVMRDLLQDFDVLAGASIKQYAHYGQNINDRKFRRWYYSPIANLAKYGRVTPPDYDISKITTTVTMHYSLNDDLLDERDVLAMAKDMPNCKVRKIARESFTHIDFVAAPDAKEMVTDYIIADLNNYNF